VVEMLDEMGGWKAPDTALWREHLHAATMIGRAAAARVAVDRGMRSTLTRARPAGSDTGVSPASPTRWSRFTPRGPRRSPLNASRGATAAIGPGRWRPGPSVRPRRQRGWRCS
jgi:hypothetical protein